MPSKRTAAPPRRQRPRAPRSASTAAAKSPRPKRATRTRRHADRIAAQLQPQLRTLRHALREEHRAVQHWQAVAQRLPTLEAEIAQLRREVGPQRPLPAVSVAPAGTREPWLPPIVEAHLTALNDHDAEHAARLFADDGSAIDVAAVLPPARTPAGLASFHAALFGAWAEFRFFPRAWHNLRSAAFLEGDASFIIRRPCLGAPPPAGGLPISIDIMFVYNLTVERIARFKMYYDAAGLLAQLRRPAQGALFSAGSD